MFARRTLMALLVVAPALGGAQGSAAGTGRDSAVALGGVRITGEKPAHMSPKLAGFEERRRGGVGQFLDRTAIAKWESHRTADMLGTLRGVQIRHGSTSHAWVSTGRSVNTSGCAFCRERIDSILDPADIERGARLACYMDAYVDGVMVYNATQRRVPLFDVNSIPPGQIAAVEVYTGSSQIPAQYNRTSGGCGVMLIWTRDGWP